MCTFMFWVVMWCWQSSFPGWCPYGAAGKAWKPWKTKQKQPGQKTLARAALFLFSNQMCAALAEKLADYRNGNAKQSAADYLDHPMP